MAPSLQCLRDMPSSWLHALLGGALIGLASATLLLTHGRIAGISGVTGSLLQPTTRDRGWRYAFLGGLVIHGGLQGWWIAPVLSSLAEEPLFLGATILTILPEALRTFDQQFPGLRMVIYALLLILLMIFRPQGLLGRREFAWAWLRPFKRRPVLG